MSSMVKISMLSAQTGSLKTFKFTLIYGSNKYDEQDELYGGAAPVVASPRSRCRGAMRWRRFDEFHEQTVRVDLEEAALLDGRRL